jgi:hypothetical protein
MEISISGYFKRVDKYNNIRLSYLDEKDMNKLKNCENVWNFPEGYKTPIFPNVVIIKHNTQALVYDSEGKPTFTFDLMNQKVTVLVKATKYKFRPKKSEEFIHGWTLKLVKMVPF